MVGCRAGIRYRFGGRNTADFTMYLRVRAIEKLVVEWGSAVAISDLHQKNMPSFRRALAAQSVPLKAKRGGLRFGHGCSGK